MKGDVRVEGGSGVQHKHSQVIAPQYQWELGEWVQPSAWEGLCPWQADFRKVQFWTFSATSWEFFPWEF